MSKPIICLDFDGTIHDYTKGWQDGRIYGNFVPGFVAWAIQAAHHFTLVIYSSRSATPEGIDAMQLWMRDQLRMRFMPNDIDNFMSLFKFANEKPPAFLTIDDRAIQFNGRWDGTDMDPVTLRNFKPWNAQQGV